MAETIIGDYTRLRCDCGGDLFVPLVGLKYKHGAGTITEPAGHQCIACRGVVDNARMVFLVERQRKQEEIKRLQAEIGPEPPVAGRTVAAKA